VNEQDENKLIAERKSKLASLREVGNPFVNDFKPKDIAQNLHESSIKQQTGFSSRVIIKFL